MFRFIKQSARAIFAGVATGGAALYTAAIENGGSLSGFEDATWIGIGLGAFTAFAGVWGFVNIKGSPSSKA